MTKLIKLKFKSEEEFLEARKLIPENSYIIKIGEIIDGEEVLEGFHVDLLSREELGGLEEWIVTPSVPRREVF